MHAAHDDLCETTTGGFSDRPLQKHEECFRTFQAEALLRRESLAKKGLELVGYDTIFANGFEIP